MFQKCKNIYICGVENHKIVFLQYKKSLKGVQVFVCVIFKNVNVSF